MRVKTTVNYPCPEYNDQVSSPLIINWINDNYHQIPENVLYFTVQVETDTQNGQGQASQTSQASQVGIRLIIREGTEPDLDRLQTLKADIIGWCYPSDKVTHYLTPQIRFRLDHYWVSIDAFVQALESNRKIKPFISGRLLGIGGLSGYSYQTTGLIITNSAAIFSDLNYNRIPAELVDYQSYQISVADGDYQTILINIGITGLTPNLKRQLPGLKFQRLYYIGCQVEKNRQDLEYFFARPEEFKVVEIEYERVWLFTVESLAWKEQLVFLSDVARSDLKTSDLPGKGRTLVSLGTTCCVAYNLDRLGLRQQAFPFDWVKMTVNQLLAVLEDDFQKWFELTVVKTSDQHPLLIDNWEDNQISTLVVQNSYGVKFYHDFKAGIALELQLPAFIEKYTRRIDRFRELNSRKRIKSDIGGDTTGSDAKSDTTGGVEFILYSHRINSATVAKIATQLQGKLTIICSNEIDVDSVRVLKDNGVHPDWKLSNFDWDRIL